MLHYVRTSRNRLKHNQQKVWERRKVRKVSESVCERVPTSSGRTLARARLGESVGGDISRVSYSRSTRDYTTRVLIFDREFSMILTDRLVRASWPSFSTLLVISLTQQIIRITGDTGVSLLQGLEIYMV